MKKTRLLLLGTLLGICTALFCWGSVSRAALSAAPPDAAPHTEEQQPEITFTTAKAVGDSITLDIGAEGNFLVEGATFIDTIYEENTPLLQYKVDNQDITIKGNVTIFYCFDNKVVNLNVSKNALLEELFCNYNQLTSLDLSKNSQLQRLRCENNQLTKLDLSKNTQLEDITCFNNSIKDTAMEKLVQSLPRTEEGVFTVFNRKGDNNLITKSQVKVATDKGWTVTDRRGYPYEGYDKDAPAPSNVGAGITSFTTAKAVGDTITLGIDANGDFIVEGATFIDTLYKNNTPYFQYRVDQQSITIKGYLPELSCSGNELTSLDASKNTQLKDLEVSRNQLTNLRVPQGIMTLQCDHNQLTNLDLSKNTQLQELSCKNNQLTSLDVSKNALLGSLDCSYNKLTSLDMSKNTRLGYLDCSYNKLTRLDMPKSTRLDLLLCNNNRLKRLDVSKNIELTTLYASSNQLTYLKVSPNIETILCDDNQLTSLDVSKSTQLNMLYCSNNKLTSLDVSKNTLLENLECDNNAIKGTAMNKLVQSLPQTEQGIFCMFNSNGDENVITKSQVNIARSKGWETLFKGKEKFGFDLPLPYLGLGNDRLSFTTNKEVGDSIIFYVGIDSIGEGFRIAEGTQISKSVTQQGKLHRFIYRIERSNQTFTIEGDIAQFICRNSGITSIESFRSDKARRMRHSHIRTLNAVNKMLATAQNLRVLDVTGNLLTAPSLQKNHILTSRRVPSSRARGVTILRQGGRTTKVVR